MTNFTDQDLDERLASLPPEAQPSTDLWPAVQASLPPRRDAAPTAQRWLQIAAAIALFSAGLLAGRSLDARPGSGDDATPVGLAVAAEVQRTGAAYVKALADLRAAKEALPATVVMQGRGAAIATMEGAAWELERFGVADDTATRILALASMDREERER